MITNFVMKYIFTPKRVLPMVYKWALSEWQKGRGYVEAWVYENLITPLLGKKATELEYKTWVLALENLIVRVSKLDEWHALVNATLPMLKEDERIEAELVGPRLEKK